MFIVKLIAASVLVAIFQVRVDASSVFSIPEKRLELDFSEGKLTIDFTEPDEFHVLKGLEYQPQGSDAKRVDIRPFAKMGRVVRCQIGKIIGSSDVVLALDTYLVRDKEGSRDAGTLLFYFDGNGYKQGETYVYDSGDEDATLWAKTTYVAGQSEHLRSTVKGNIAGGFADLACNRVKVVCAQYNATVEAWTDESCTLQKLILTNPDGTKFNAEAGQLSRVKNVNLQTLQGMVSRMNPLPMGPQYAPKIGVQIYYGAFVEMVGAEGSSKWLQSEANFMPQDVGYTFYTYEPVIKSNTWRAFSVSGSGSEESSGPLARADGAQVRVVDVKTMLPLGREPKQK